MERISIVIPIKDEQENLPRLRKHLCDSLAKVASWEAIIVDDGSTDDSFVILAQIAQEDTRFKVIQFRRNFGQAAAMQSGIDAATGSIIATMDGDLQNDPSDIPMMIEKLNEGYDVVLGQRANRNDSYWIRKFPSRIANWVIRRVTGIPFQDFGCTLRVMRADVAKQFRIYGEMHRFIPVLAMQLGARMTQVPVKHHAREAGKSKYGLGRTRRVILDLITVKFFSAYLTRPMHFMGGAGLMVMALGFLSLFLTVAMKLIWQTDMTGNPLLLLSVLLSLVGIQFVSMGLLGEVMIRTYFESQNKSSYQIRQTRNIDESEAQEERKAA